MKKIALLAAVTLAVGITGCTTSKVPTIDAKYYPECYDPIDKLCKDQDNSSEVKSAVGGAVIGALGGALVGALSSEDKGKGALIGAVAGAVVGGAAGFFKARLEKIADREKRLEEYKVALGEVAASMDLETASVEKALDCYIKQIALLKKGYKSKSVSEEEFLARMDEIKAGINNINTYWSDASKRIDEQLADGQQFIVDEKNRIAAEEKAKQIKKRQAEQYRLSMKRNEQNTQQLINKKTDADKRIQMKLLTAQNEMQSDRNTESMKRAMNEQFIDSVILALNMKEPNSVN